MQQLPTLLGQQCWDLECIVGRIQPLRLCKLHGDHVKCACLVPTMLELELPSRSNIVALRFGWSCGSKVWLVFNFALQTQATCNNVASVCTGLNWGFCLLNQLIFLFLEFACPLLSQCWDSRMRFANGWYLNQRRSGRKVTNVSTNVRSIVPRPRVPEVLFSRVWRGASAATGRHVFDLT